MFGDKKHPPQKRIDCLIGATTVRGDIVFKGGLRIDQVHGNVATADGQAGGVVSEHAKVEGEIRVLAHRDQRHRRGAGGSKRLPGAAAEGAGKPATWRTRRSRCTSAPWSRAGSTTARREPETAEVVELKRVGA